jgi:hypothetical protein
LPGLVFSGVGVGVLCVGVVSVGVVTVGVVSVAVVSGGVVTVGVVSVAVVSGGASVLADPASEQPEKTITAIAIAATLHPLISPPSLYHQTGVR